MERNYHVKCDITQFIIISSMQKYEIESNIERKGEQSEEIKIL